MLAVVAAAFTSSAQEAGNIPPAFNPVMTVNSLIPQTPSKVTHGNFKLTPASCSSSTAAAVTSVRGRRRHRRRATASSSSSTCTGFDISTDPTFNTSVNSAVLSPAQAGVVIDPMQPLTYVIGALTLTNNGLTQPADARAILVPVKANITFNTPLVNKPTNLVIFFQVMWSSGSPAPVNTAGIFALATKTPAPSYNFTASMSSQVDFNMNLQLVGFVADPDLGKDAVVLGDVGQPAPNAGDPGPRVYINRGSPQVVRLHGLISNTANPSG